MPEAQGRYDVSIGDVRDSQIVIGDHTTVVTPDGVKVVRLVGDARPQLREAPAGSRPRSAARPIGRDDAVELARRAAPGWPLQLFGRDGIGKTAIVKHVAAEAPHDPVIYAAARRRSLDDIHAALFRSFWEAEERFVPAPDEMRSYLGERAALVVLDDLALDRDDLAVLLDTASGCTFVVTSLARSLWDAGAAQELQGLTPEDSIRLLERALARSLTDEERMAAQALATSCGGHPQTLVEIAASVLDRRASLEELARARPPAQPPIAEVSDDQRRLLDVLASCSGAALGADHVGALAGVPDPEAELEELERRGWVKSQSPRYRLARPVTARDEDATVADLAHHLASWARSPSTGPDEVARESEAVEGAIDEALGRDRPDLALLIAKATEAKLAVSGLLGSWERVLAQGLAVVRAGRAGLPADEAYFLHQLGSRAIAVHDGRARGLLLEALEIREMLGDVPGAELTRHNLAQIGYHANGRGKRPPRRRWWIFGILLLLLAGAAAALLAAGGHDETAATVAPKPPPPPRPPVARISHPRDKAHFKAGASIRAKYSCKPAAAKCTATADGTRVHEGELLPNTPGTHTLFVRASERRYGTVDTFVRYRVAAIPITPTVVQPTPPPTTPAPTTPPPTTATTPPPKKKKKCKPCGEGPAKICCSGGNSVQSP